MQKKKPPDDFTAPQYLQQVLSLTLTRGLSNQIQMWVCFAIRLGGCTQVLFR